MLIPPGAIDKERRPRKSFGRRWMRVVVSAALPLPRAEVSHRLRCWSRRSGVQGNFAVRVRAHIAAQRLRTQGTASTYVEFAACNAERVSESSRLPRFRA